MYEDSSLTLVLNGAEARLQIVCGNPEALIFSQEWFTPRQGMKVLTPALMQALNRMGLSLDAIGRIAIVRGPGSFTGLRLVLATALGLARPLGLTMAGIGYMDALAADALCLAGSSPVWVLTHARRDLVHIQGFSGMDAQGLPVAITLPDSASLEGAASLIRTFVTDGIPAPILLGSGVRKNAAFIAEHLSAATILPARFDQPAPETLLYLAQHAQYSAEQIEPLYIRPCDAEENLDAIAAAKGMNPSAARATLEKLTHS